MGCQQPTSFTTGFATDTGAPQLVGASPADGATAVPTNVRIVLEFDEPLNTIGVSQGLLVTRTLVVLGDNQVTSPPGRPRGAMLRAYDKETGKNVGEVLMPAGQSGSPMTYMANGKQYIVIAVAEGNHAGEYLAFALPDSEIRSTGQNQQ